MLLIRIIICNKTFPFEKAFHTTESVIIAGNWCRKALIIKSEISYKRWKSSRQFTIRHYAKIRL